MPGFWPLSRKAKTYVTTPMPGPHPKYSCLPLKVVIRDVLKLAETSTEAVKILNTGKVLVDKKVRKNPKFPVGLMDIIEIPELHARYRINVNKNGLHLERIKEEETGIKLCRIVGKTTIKGGKNQLNLHDGRNILTKENYTVGDSVVIEIPDQKIIKHYSLKKGEHTFVIAGRNMGMKGQIKDIKQRKSLMEKSIVTIVSADGKEIQTLRDYVMVGLLNENEASDHEEKEKKPEARRKKEHA